MNFLRKKTVLITLCTVLIVLGVCTACSGGKNEIPGGIKAGGISISNLTVEEAAQKLRENLEDVTFDTPVGIVFGNKEKEVIPADFLAAYDYEKTAEKAAQMYQDEGFFKRLGTSIGSIFSKTEIGMELSYDEMAYKEIIEGLLADVEDRIEEHTWEIEDDMLIVTTGRPGLMPDEATVSEAILEKIRMGSYEEKIVFEKESRNPAPLSAEALHKEVCAEPENAYYAIENGKVVMHSHVLGVSFNVKEAEGIIEAHPGYGVTFEVPLLIEEPETTLEDIENELFSDVIGEYTTKFNTGDTSRSKNIALATNKINGTVLAPDEIFSYNGVVGERSYSEGFETANVYVNGETVPGIGGGICQVSSTLFNAVVFANLEIVERVNHQLTVSYVPLGRDATVDYGNIDFRFRNTTGYPIKIVCSSDGGKMYMGIYGCKDIRKDKVTFETVTVGHTAPPERKQEDPTLPLGEEKVESQGSSGYVVDTYKVVEKAGQAPEKVFLCRSNYSGSLRIIRVGTGEAVASPTPSVIEGNIPSNQQPVVNTVPGNVPQTSINPEKTQTPTPDETEVPVTAKPVPSAPAESSEPSEPDPTPAVPDVPEVDTDVVSDTGL